MTLEQAICQIQNALIKTKRPVDTAAGIAPSEATVVLALGSTTVYNGKLGAKATLGIVEWAPEGGWSNEGSLANTLTIKFVASKSTTGGSNWLPSSFSEQPTTGIPPVLPDCSEFSIAMPKD